MRHTLLFCLLFPVIGYCQNTIGLPDVSNYYKGTYNAGLQNWDIKQDRNGIIYVANNEGLLSFDGRYWNLYPLPNKTIARSIEIGADNRIYVGGQDELGYYAPAINGKLEYISLTRLIPEKDRSFGDVWDIVSIKKDLFFRTPSKIFKITNDAVAVYNAPSEWVFMGVCNGHLFSQDTKEGLLTYENNVWAQLPTANKLPANDPITAILPIQKGGIIITTLKNGLFTFADHVFSKINSTATAVFERERIYSAISISPEWIALATNNGGVYITDIKGQLIQSFSKNEGLQDNNVLSIFLDKQSNLWLGLNNGIDFIAYNSSIKRITPFSQEGSGYAAIVHKNHLYAGTSAGLFKVPLQPNKDLSFSKGNFSPVANSSGQVWGLAEINGKLLMGHHEGAFEINDNTAIQISSIPGFWNFTPMSSVYPSARTVAGNYKGLTFFNYTNNAFSIAENMPAFNESSRFVALDKYDNIWVSHPYHGVYKITVAKDGRYTKQLYTSKNGLPSTLNNHVYKIKNEVVVATEKGIFLYNQAKNIFEASGYYQKILGSQSLRYLSDDTEGNIWFIHEKNLGVVDMSDKQPEIIYLLELNNKLLSGFEFIYTLNANNIFVGGEKGFFHINYEKYKKNMPALPAQIRTVRIVADKDSLLFGGYFSEVNEKQIQTKAKIPEVNSDWKTIHFEYSTPLFGQQTNLEYSYKLQGFDENWAGWSNKTEKEYTNLPHGNYTFQIKVRNNLGNESAQVLYSFKILPPWYKSKLAYFIYFLLLCLAIYFLNRWQRNKYRLQKVRYEEEQKKLQYLHQLEIDKAANELVILRNEKLQAEVDFKNSELATSAMHLVQKGELLTKVKTELNRLIKVLDNEKPISELKKMIKVLSEDDKMDKNWEHFAQHFDKVHRDFVVILKEKHTTITGNELKLSAYLRMNLSTKEIAQLMNISVRGIEISRYRLRKKLGISSEVNLFDYLISLA